MESKGTKGNWEVKSMDDTFIINENGKGILCIQHNGCFDYKEMPYNAKLIACAPEMLELLKSISTSENVPNYYRKSAINLIKKATE